MQHRQKRRPAGRPRGPVRVQTKIRLRPETHEGLIERAAEEGRSITAVLERAVLAYLDREAGR